MSRPFIPFFRPDIGEAAIERVAETIRGGWLSTGPLTHEFEEQFAEFVGAEHAVAVNSCTAALHVTLAALDIGPGDEVIVPTWTFGATAAVVIHLGATPVLVDVDRASLNIQPQLVETAITERTKAVIPVHFAGHPAPMDPLLDLAERHGLAIVEDAAHALPARYRDRLVGTIGTATCFSFYATKTITTGEGGMITTDDAGLANRARVLALHGLSNDAWARYTAKGSWDYDIAEPGYKYNLTDIASAIGIEQLARAHEFLEARVEQAAWYDTFFSEVAGVEPLRPAEDTESAWHLYPIVLDRDSIGRDEMIEGLREAGIGASVHFRPLHLHSYYREQGHRADDYPIATDVFPRILSLPLYPRLAEDDLHYVGETVQRMVSGGATTLS
jgi:dTDP-4-amino-4,6-dideoxygalactose transaminase